MTTAAATTPGVALTEREDNELLALIRTHPDDDELQEAAREVLVTRYQSLVRGCVQRYRDSPEPVEDLMQAGYVGLLKAINNFDPVLGQNLAAYASPCVSGEIKRHFRDKRWQIGTSAGRSTSSGPHRNCCCRSAGRAPSSPRSWAALPGTRRWRVIWA
jgi:RNA polymerase sigma-B factor